MKLTPYESNRTLTPKNIPLEHVFLNPKDFQNRQNPYSEESVQRIIDSVLNWEFYLIICDPIILWLNPEDNKLYALSGHSRYEAFKRLSTTYATDPQVQEYTTKYPYLFSHIPGRILEGIGYEQAKTVAQLSNVLATPETDVERAKLYRSYRELWKSKQRIEKSGNKYAGKHRPTIRAYSYLNPNGVAIAALERFEKNQDESNIIKRVVKRIGEARMRYPCLQDHHERELYDRLMIYGWYGNKSGQINSQPKFLELLKRKIEQISPRNNNTPLNMKGDKALPYALAEYYKMLKWFQNDKQYLERNLQEGLDEYQKNVIKDSIEKDIIEYKKNISEAIQIPLENLSKFEGIEETLFNIKEYFSPENVNKIAEITCLQIARIKEKINKHKWKKEQFIEAWKQELKINFSEP